MSKIYVAARFSEKEKARSVMDELIKRGHSITHDWTVHERDGERYSPEEALIYAIDDIYGVVRCDAFILLATPLMRGALVELGAAIGLGKAVYVVDAPYDNIFYYHPVISHRTIEEVLEEIG